MTRLLPLLAAVGAVGVGFWAQPAANPARHAGAGDATAHWGAANGYTLESTRRLSATGHYLIHYFRRLDGCDLTVVPLGHPDEVMPLLAGMATARDRAQARLLTTTIGPMPEGALAVHLRRLRDRLVHGHAPQPVMLIAEADCMRSPSGEPLKPWSAL